MKAILNEWINNNTVQRPQVTRERPLALGQLENFVKNRVK